MTEAAAPERSELETQLGSLGRMADDEIDLAEAALLLAARDRPRVPLARYRHHIALLQKETARCVAGRAAPPSLADCIAALRQVIVEDHGYQGDSLTYDDLQNANLMRVIDRRKGLPVALGILYIAAGRSQGWAIAGLNFPGHVLLALEQGGARAIIDPFAAARELDSGALRQLLKRYAGAEEELAPEHYAPVDNRGILLRLQNNIKLRLLQERRVEAALEILESMLLFAPDEAALWYEAGVINEHLGKLRAALSALERVRELAAQDGLRHEAARRMQQVKARLQ